MLTMAPGLLCSIQCRAVAREQLKVPLSTISTTVRKPFGESSLEATMKLPAALLINTSRRPNFSTVPEIKASTCSGMRTSVAMACAVTPRAASSATASSSTACLRLAMTTLAPSTPSVAAITLPIPVPPPVTIATCSLNESLGSIRFRLGRRAQVQQRALVLLLLKLFRFRKRILLLGNVRELGRVFRIDRLVLRPFLGKVRLGEDGFGRADWLAGAAV